jgi:hypothetical protein
MKVLIYRDATVALPLSKIVTGISRVCASLEVNLGAELVEIPGKRIRPESYARLPSSFVLEARSSDLAVVATSKRYENGFFYDSEDTCVAIVSLAEWESLTNLPLSNGFVFFLAELIGRGIRLGSSHIGTRDNSARGCLNDFRQRKSDIDFAMRAGFVC